MLNTSSPYPAVGYISSPYSGSASPVSARPTPPPGSKPGSSRNTPKPVNVFTNDGSFLERIQRSKREEEQKQKEAEALETKKNFDNRFRNRGKRRHPESASRDEDAPKPDEEEYPFKKVKSDDDPKAEYGKQLKTFENREGMKDTGTGVRPLVR